MVAPDDSQCMEIHVGVRSSTLRVWIIPAHSSFRDARTSETGFTKDLTTALR